MDTHWHPFPEERPRHEGFHLVTMQCLDGNRNIVIRTTVARAARWPKDGPIGFGGLPEDMVLAWMEYPEPYKTDEVKDDD